MNGLHWLTSDDFSLDRGTKGEIMRHGIPGFSLILFYSTKCEHCQDLLPLFKRLPGAIGGCQFGIMNVSNNKRAVRMSRQTVAPITYVPYIVMYIDGKPFMRYNGPQDINEIARFVIEVAQNVKSKQEFSQDAVKKPEDKIPEYSIGVPLCGDGKVCYLAFNDAYDN